LKDHPATIWLEEEDWQRLKTQAERLYIPPHVYARSILVRAVNAVEREKAGKATDADSNAICGPEGGA
jgi:hypothetical protein